MAKKNRIQDFETLDLLNQSSGITPKENPDVVLFTPEENMISYVKDEKKDYLFDGEKWVEQKKKKLLLFILIPFLVLGLAAGVTVPIVLANIARESVTYREFVVNGKVYTMVLDPGVSIPEDAISYNQSTGKLEVKDAEKKGYDFEGWFIDEDKTTPFDPNNTNEDQHLYPKFKATTYNINYYLYDGVNSSSNPSTYTIETDTITLASATKEGYSFGGWYKESSYSTKVEKIEKGSTGDLDLHAKWTDSGSSSAPSGSSSQGTSSSSQKNTYTVTFVGSGTSDIPAQEVAPGGKATNPGNLDDTEYLTFVGWYADMHGQNLFDFNSAITEDTVIYSRFVRPDQTSTSTVTISFDSKGGTPASYEPQTVLAGTYLTAPAAPSREYSTFVGWGFSKEYIIDFDKQPMWVDNTYDAIYEIAPEGIWTITYETNGGEKVYDHQEFESTYNIYMSYLDIPYLHKEHYEFDGWYLDSEFTEENKVGYSADPHSDTRFRGSITLYAKFHLRKFSVSFGDTGGNGGGIAPSSPYPDVQIVEYGGLITNPDVVPTPYTYNTFEGWYGKDEETGKYYLYDFSQPLLLSDDVYFYTIYALFSPNVVYELVGEGTENEHYVITGPGTYTTEYAGSGGATHPLTIDVHNNIPITEVAAGAFNSSWPIMKGGIETGPNVKKIGQDAFKYAGIDDYAWSWIDLSRSPDIVLEQGAFYEAGEAYEIRLPDTLKNIPDYCFTHCTVDTSIDLPKALESIGIDAFANNGNLATLFVPKALKTVANGAFNGCPITKILYEGTEEDRALIDIGDNNDNFESATWYYFTENGEDETRPGHWWYYDQWGYSRIEKTVA